MPYLIFYMCAGPALRDSTLNMEGLNTLATSFSNSATELNKLSLALLGGSLLLVLSTDYISHISKKAKLFYLLLIPAWAFLVISIVYGNIVGRQFPAYQFTPVPELKDSICESMNDNYSLQLDLFDYSIYCFSLWLVCYLVWWIFFSQVNRQNGTTKTTVTTCVTKTETEKTETT